jgi:hypothetical protein
MSHRKFYEQLGQLVYAVAAIDGTIQEAEINRVNTMFREWLMRPQDAENSEAAAKIYGAKIAEAQANKRAEFDKAMLDFGDKALLYLMGIAAALAVGGIVKLFKGPLKKAFTKTAAKTTSKVVAKKVATKAATKASTKVATETAKKTATKAATKTVATKGTTSLLASGADDVATYARSRPLKNEPGSVWSYSSGTTNIICSLLNCTSIYYSNIAFNMMFASILGAAL